MIPVPSGVKVWLATGYTDMRKGFPGLSLIVQEVLKRDPHSGHLFCFRGRQGGLIKVIWTCLPFMWSARRMLIIWVAGSLLFLVVVRGGYFGLALVSSGDWGGLTLTLFIYISVIALGMPIAIFLSLVRAGRYPAFRWLSGVVIDVTRSLPLVCILFASIVILPFVVPETMLGDRVFRVIVGFAFFFGCCQSEILRGALISLPPGQDEAGRSLGMTYAQRMNLIVLPQVFKMSMPLTINQLVVTFKETSLVAIVGLFDLMTSANAAYNTADFNVYYKEVYAFTALIYFVFVFILSRYGRFLERRGGS
ncbi:MAG: ABC transporter permease subunit [Hyphomicrobiales bacterium]|nr:MAG: ABC transporter permease subunit [Hyphomicrobiales bacterium]